MTLAFGAFFLLLSGCPSPADPPPELPVGNAVGNRAPALQGTLATGEEYELPAPLGAATVLVFYRGLDCGLCRVRLEQLQSHLAAYQRQGAHVLAITLDPPESSLALADQMGLEMAILSVDSATFDAWGGLHPDTRIPLPAAYILDAAGVIQYRHVGRNAGDRTTDASLITLLQTLDDA